MPIEAPSNFDRSSDVESVNRLRPESRDDYKHSDADADAVDDAAAVARGEQPVRGTACHQEPGAAAAQGFERELLRLPRLLAGFMFEAGDAAEAHAEAEVDLARQGLPYFDREGALLGKALQRGDARATRKWTQDILQCVAGDDAHAPVVRDRLVAAAQAGVAGGPRTTEQLDALVAFFEVVLEDGWVFGLPDRDKLRILEAVVRPNDLDMEVSKDLFGTPFAMEKLAVTIARSTPDEALRQQLIQQLGIFAYADGEGRMTAPSQHQNVTQLLQSPAFDLEFKKALVAEVRPGLGSARTYVARLPKHAGAVIVSILTAAIPDASKATLLRAMPYSPEDVLIRLLRNVDMSDGRADGAKWARKMHEARRLMTENPA